MIIKNLKNIISNGEGLTLEFKESHSKVNSDVYQSICAFLNRNGGRVILGVKDDCSITGIKAEALEQMKKDLVTSLNNPQKINPPLYILPEEIEIDGKRLLLLDIPESSQVHRCNNRIYDRNEDGDFNITDNTNLVAQLYIRKQSTYSENRIYPYVVLEDLRPDLIQRVRSLAKGQRPDHPWAELDDLALLKSARLFHKDYQTGKQGFTLAAVLLFGKDDVILNILPHHKTDALLRADNIDRYDDRDDIRTNLIESYDRLMGFTAKHLPDKFYLIRDQRVSLRDRIFREVATNILIHREFLNPFPAKFIIKKDCVYTENANKANGQGLIDPINFTPFPKNPVIARVFKEMGRADELGSGVKNLFNYTKKYSGADPQLVEEDIFRIIIPLSEQVTEQVTEQAVSAQLISF
uniref:RNA-binding domain-containing protein n=1 Tax=Desulfobacula sp. TaxID=2593537 RepID=UPI002714E51E